MAHLHSEGVVVLEVKALYSRTINGSERLFSVDFCRRGERARRTNPTKKVRGHPNRILIGNDVTMYRRSPTPLRAIVGKWLQQFQLLVNREWPKKFEAVFFTDSEDGFKISVGHFTGFGQVTLGGWFTDGAEKVLGPRR